MMKKYAWGWSEKILKRLKNRKIMVKHFSLSLTFHEDIKDINALSKEEKDSSQVFAWKAWQRKRHRFKQVSNRALQTVV